MQPLVAHCRQNQSAHVPHTSAWWCPVGLVGTYSVRGGATHWDICANRLTLEKKNLMRQTTASAMVKL